MKGLDGAEKTYTAAIVSSRKAPDSLREAAPQDVGRLVAHIDRVLGDSGQWLTPAGYPDSLALCLIDCIYSIGIRYDAHVVPILGRYRRSRLSAGRDAQWDTASDLLAFFAQIGGPQAFANQIGTQHKTSSHRSAPLKASAAHLPAELFLGAGVESPQDLLVGTLTNTAIRRSWRSLPGQRSSDIGWQYLQLPAGADEVKPDRMICRFVGRALDRNPVPPLEVSNIVRIAAQQRG